MKKLFVFLLLFVLSVDGFAQFTISGADDYLKQKAQQAEKQRVQDSINQVRLEEQQMMAGDIRYRIKWTNMITYRQSIGYIENTYNLSYYGYLTSKEAWTFPISLRITGAENFNDKNMKAGYKDWSQGLTDFGMSGFRRIKGDEYISLGVHLPIGFERYRYVNSTDTKKHWHLLIGASLEERLMYISPNKTGLVMSVGFYQLLINSKRYTIDAGFSLEIGVKF
jgi:hypothetical protein